MGMSEMALMALAQEGWFQQPKLTKSATTRPTFQAFESAQANIYPIFDLWKHVRELALWNHSHRLSMTGNNRLSKRSLSEGPVLMAYQKLEALNPTSNTQHYEYFQVKVNGQKGILHDTPRLPTTKMNEEMLEKQERRISKAGFFCLLFCLHCFVFNVFKVSIEKHTIGVMSRYKATENERDWGA